MQLVPDVCFPRAARHVSASASLIAPNIPCLVGGCWAETKRKSCYDYRDTPGLAPGAGASRVGSESRTIRARLLQRRDSVDVHALSERVIVLFHCRK